MLRYRRWLAALLALLAALALAQPAMAITPEDYSSKLPQVLTGDHLYSSAALLMDADTGEVLLEKNADKHMFPASTTKIMTLTLALESGISLDTDIVIPEQAADIPKDSSLVPVYPGDQTTFKDLLFGFMLNSGNDGANAVATLVAGDVQLFVDRMNQRARELGCTGTHFVNPHGYHDENHYTTARDLAIMTRHALTLPTFQQIVSTSRYTFNVLRNREPISFRINNTNLLLNNNSPFYYSGCIGVKTGSHEAAGQCFVGASERDGIRLIAVALNCEESDDKWRDTIRMMNYGYTQYTAYTMEQLFKLASPQIATVKISNAVQSDPQRGAMDLDIAEISDTEYHILVRTNSTDELDRVVNDFVARTEMVITDDMVAPVSKGEIMGNLKFVTKNGQEITALLVASRDLAEQPPSLSMLDVFPVLAVFRNKLVMMLMLVLLVLFVLILVALHARQARIDRRRTSIYRARKREIESAMGAYKQKRGKGRSGGKPVIEETEVDSLFAGDDELAAAGLAPETGAMDAEMAEDVYDGEDDRFDEAEDEPDDADDADDAWEDEAEDDEDSGRGDDPGDEDEIDFFDLFK